MDKNNQDPAARKLMEAFTQFHRLKWRKSPVAGLKRSEIAVLFNIKKTLKTESPGIKVSDISSALQVAAPTITQLINSLEADGFVERTMDKEDRRAVRVNITVKGEAAIDKASKTFYKSFNGLVRHLGEVKSNQLAELLSEVFVYFKNSEQ
jgi:DNA-binding MarR family transcriptional regulator